MGNRALGLIIGELPANSSPHQVFGNTSQSQLNDVIIPDEILLEVMDFLETREIFTCRRVCKYWLQFVKRAPMNKMVFFPSHVSSTSSMMKGSFPLKQLLTSKVLCLNNLQSLVLVQCNLNDNQMVQIATCKYVNNVQKLNLSKNNIGLDGVSALASSSFLTNLTSLDLSDNHCANSAFINKICDSTVFRKLKGLDISGNVIKNEDLDTFSNSENMRGLTYLNLSNSELVNKGSYSYSTVELLEKSLHNIQELLLDEEMLLKCGAQCKLIKEPIKAFHCFELAAKKNNHEALFQIGACYGGGHGVPQSMKNSVLFYELSAKHGNPQSMNILGSVFMEGLGGYKMDFTKGMEYFKASANLNLADAHFNLAELYYQGLKVPRDYKKAAEHYKLASDKYHYTALIKLGTMYGEGKGVERNFKTACEMHKKAFDYFEKIAPTKVYAKYELSIMYLEGLGTVKNVTKALELLNSASQSNYEKAHLKLGDLYFSGIDVTRDLKKAKIFFLKSNSTHALNKLGDLFTMKKNLKKAMTYYMKSANRNNPFAQRRLGQIYFKKGTPDDMVKSFNYFEKASLHNDPISLRTLGVMYREGLGTEKDLEKSFQYLESASKLDDKTAQITLGLCHTIGVDTPVDFTKGFQSLHKCGVLDPLEPYTCGMRLVRHLQKKESAQLPNATMTRSLTLTESTLNTNSIKDIQEENAKLKQQLEEALKKIALLEGN